MVGVGRFELPASCSQSRRANQAALHPVGVTGKPTAAYTPLDPIDVAEDYGCGLIERAEEVVTRLRISVGKTSDRHAAVVESPDQVPGAKHRSGGQSAIAPSTGGGAGQVRSPIARSAMP